MSNRRNDRIRAMLRKRAAELEPTLTVGDTSVAHILTVEFADYFRDSGVTNPYQMVCYYLRDAANTSDRRKSYSTNVLSNLALMPAEQRIDFAKATGRSIRAINAAVDRYSKEQYQNSRTPKAIANARLAIQTKGYFDFSSEVELAAVGLTRGVIMATRKAIYPTWGLALRSPNILYHAVTHKRYYMTEAEQVSLLDNPGKFLRGRSAHIRDNWVISALDPVAETSETAQTKKAKSSIHKRDTFGTTDSGGVDFVVKQMRKPRLQKYAEQLLTALEHSDHPDTDSQTFKTLLALHNEIGVVLGNLDPSPSKTFNGDTSKLTPRTEPATHWVDDGNGKLVEIVNPDANATPSEDDDRWMADFKPVSV